MTEYLDHVIRSDKYLNDLPNTLIQHHPDVSPSPELPSFLSNKAATLIPKGNSQHTRCAQGHIRDFPSLWLPFTKSMYKYTASVIVHKKDHNTAVVPTKLCNVQAVLSIDVI